MEAAEAAKARLIIIGKKRLPDAAKHERFFGFVGEWTGRVDRALTAVGCSTGGATPVTGATVVHACRPWDVVLAGAHQ